jgi:hypothetical protein
MRKKITYLNCVLTVIAIALTVIVLQNADVIQSVKAAPQYDVLDVNIKSVGGLPVFGTIPVEVEGVVMVEIN